MYKPTDKVLDYTKLIDLTSGMSETAIDTKNDPRLNLIAVEYFIIEPPLEDIPGRIWCINNTRFVDFKHDFDCGRVTFVQG